MPYPFLLTNFKETKLALGPPTNISNFAGFDFVEFDFNSVASIAVISY